ncbi:MAG: glycosyltransferase family 2 protein [Proteobacteria bacterium]|nr:glycosyltransferase family 2 protein [Pseudomonadota bacterium]
MSATSTPADSGRHSVSFTVNACNSDAPFIESTLRHMLPALGFPFAERFITYDPGRQEGKYAERAVGDRATMEAIFQRLLDERVIDRVDVVPWNQPEQQRILGTYFGGTQVDLKDFSGAPIYQYLYALDRCEGTYVFHADSDMLFHRAVDESWIDQGIELMQQEPRVVVTCPRAGPPQARNWLERLAGRSFEPTPTEKWRRVDFTSTRYFLMDMAKFRTALPLVQSRPGEPLENSLTHTIKLRGLEHWNLTTLDHWTIHPWKHDENYVRHLPDLIWAIEQGHYPFRRIGQRWDMRTEGQHIEEWLRVLRRHGRGRGAPVVTHER